MEILKEHIQLQYTNFQVRVLLLSSSEEPIENVCASVSLKISMSKRTAFDYGSTKLNQVYNSER